MELFIVTNPQAAEAILLATASRFASRATIKHQLRATNTPRALYAIACILTTATRA